MDQYDDLSDPNAISAYFHALLDLKGQKAQDQKGILSRIQEGDFPFRTVAEMFSLIEQDTRTVYIPMADGEKLVEQLRQGERSRQLFRKLGQYGVSVYAQQFQKLDESGVLELLEDGSAILTDLSFYSDDTGLAFHADSDRFII